MKIHTARRFRRRRRLYTLAPYTPTRAQQTKVYRQRGFLTVAEVNEIDDSIMKLNLQCYTNNPTEDIDERGYAVHTTSYINSTNILNTKLLWLRKKIVDLVHAVNVDQGWQFRTESDKFNIRVAEYHEMDINGSLNDPNHYDVGSLITVDIMLKGMCPLSACFAHGRVMTYPHRSHLWGTIPNLGGGRSAPPPHLPSRRCTSIRIAQETLCISTLAWKSKSVGVGILEWCGADMRT